MNPQSLLIFIIILIFGIFSSIQDYKQRKINNKLNLLLFVIAFTFFITSLNNISFYEIIGIIILIFIYYLIYKLGFYGAADGKVLISISLLLLIVGHFKMILFFICNILIIYSVVGIFIAFIKTTTKDKIEIIKQIDYKSISFIIFIIFIISSIILKQLPKSLNPEISIVISMSTIICLYLIISKFKKYFNKIDSNNQNLILLILAITLIFISKIEFLKYFFHVILIKISYDFLRKILKKLNEKHSDKDKKQFSLALAIIIYSGALITIITSNIILFTILDLI